MLANLKAALAARGMCQIDLACELRMHPTELSAIVRCRRKASADLRRRIATRLGADEGWLFQEARIVPPSRTQTDTAAVVAI